MYNFISGKINCLYSNKDKRLIINKKVMAIIEKKYDKVYLFPSKRSPLTLILEKDKLENFLLNSELKFKIIKLFSTAILLKEK